MASKRGSRYEIVDPAALAAVVRGALDERFHGSQLAAARATGLQQSQLSRICRAQLTELAGSTIERLRQLVPEAQQAELNGALIQPMARQHLREAYDPWLAAGGRPTERRWTGSRDGIMAVRVFAGRVGETRGVDAADLMARMYALMGRQLERQFLEGWARREFPDLFTPFEAAIAQGEHSAERRALALDRVFGPLLAWRDSGFIERGWEEMGRLEIKKVLDLGMQRERILLKRANDRRRASAAMTRDPASCAEPNWVLREDQEGVQLYPPLERGHRLSREMSTDDELSPARRAPKRHGAR